MSAASKAKRDDPELEVVVFERGEWVSYAACGMPYYVKSEVESLADLVQVTPETFRTERDIDLRTGHEAVAIDHAGLTVDAVQNLDLAYASPFSPVWDPVATAAKVLAGKRER